MNLKRDLDNIIKYTKNIWKEFRNKNIFVTGGTGFFGIWIIKSFLYANKVFDLNAKMVVLSRNPLRFLRKHQDISNSKYLEFYQGDIRDFTPLDREFQFIIHGAATSAYETFINEDPLKKYDTVANGTKHLLDFAVQCKAEKILYISSGSVYGKQRIDTKCIKEDVLLAPNPLDYIASALPEAKRVGEFLCAYYSDKYDIDIKIARCFSFIGPYMPLDIHYAVGNFIKGALDKNKIIIEGDGTPLRTFMYSADLMIWLWTILIKGKSCEPYNVGSDETVSIKQLAKMVSVCFDRNIDIVIKNRPDKATSSSKKYIPCIEKSKKAFNLDIYTDLKTSIQKTINFYKGGYEI